MRYLWLIMLIQPILYWVGLQGGFVFDDHFLIVETIGQYSLADIWVSGLWQEGTKQVNFYRPLFSSTIWLDQQLFGLDPLGYRIHSLLWHCLNIVLFAKLSERILPKAEQLLPVILFSTHPLLSELVFWIAARNDSMALTFILLFLNIFWSENQQANIFPKVVPLSKIRIVVLWIVFILGLLSKETALIVFLPILISKKSTKSLVLIAGMISIVVLLFTWRYHLGISNPSIESDSLMQFINSSPEVIIDGLGRIAFPWRLSPATSINWISVKWWHGILALIVVVVVIVNIKKDHLSIWWGAWFVIGLGLAAPAIIYTGNYGDRYLALSILPWVVFLSRVLILRWGLILVPFWCVTIFLRGYAWQSDMEFWSQEKLQNPNPYTSVSLALIQYNQGDYRAAMDGFYEGFSAEPPYLDGCEAFVSSVLSAEGPRSALEASYWVVSRGCRSSGEMKGLQAVLHVGIQQWDEAQKLVDEKFPDPTRRIEIVEMLLEWRSGNRDICNLVVQWESPQRLFEQLKILSLEDAMMMVDLPCIDDSLLQTAPTRANQD